jgi:hypothetical protein
MVLTVGVFTQFIACGAELYQVSLEGDADQVNLRQPKAPDDPSFGIHARNGWQELPIRIRTAADLSREQVQAIRNAMRTWEWALGRQAGQIFLYEGIHEGMIGDRFRDLSSSLKDQINGQYFDANWSKTGKNMQVLATTIWENALNSDEVIATADIRYNTQVYLFGDSFRLKSTPERQVVDLESLALHEIGHLLGLEHVDQKTDGFSIMNPNLYVGEGLATRTLSRGDIQRIQSIYSCVGLACDIDALLRSTVEARAPENNTSASVSGESEPVGAKIQRY